jgi:hypothetical protein
MDLNGTALFFFVVMAMRSLQRALLPAPVKIAFVGLGGRPSTPDPGTCRQVPPSSRPKGLDDGSPSRLGFSGRASSPPLRALVMASAWSLQPFVNPSTPRHECRGRASQSRSGQGPDRGLFGVNPEPCFALRVPALKGGVQRWRTGQSPPITGLSWIAARRTQGISRRKRFEGERARFPVRRTGRANPKPERIFLAGENPRLPEGCPRVLSRRSRYPSG